MNPKDTITAIVARMIGFFVIIGAEEIAASHWHLNDTRGFLISVIPTVALLYLWTVIVNKTLRKKENNNG